MRWAILLSPKAGFSGYLSAVVDAKNISLNIEFIVH